MMKKNKAVKIAILVVTGVVSLSTPTYALSLKDLNTRVKKQYIEHKTQYLRTGNLYENAKKDYLKVREDLGRYKSGDVKQFSLERAKEYFLKVGQGMMKYLELIKRKVERAKGLSEEQRSNLVAEIDKDVAWLQSKQEEVQKAESREELRALAKEVRDYWKEVRKKVRGIIGRMMGYRVGHVIEKMEAVGEKVRRIIDKLAADGKDVTDLEKWYASYQEHLEKAKDNYEMARTKYEEIEKVADEDKVVRGGNEYMRAVNAHLREAHKALKKIVLEIKTM